MNHDQFGSSMTYAILLMVGMAAGLTVAFHGLSLQNRRRAHPLDLIVWLGVLILVPVAIASTAAASPRLIVVIVVACLVVVLLVACVAIVRTIIALKRDGMGRAPVMWFLGSMPAVGVLIALALPEVASQRIGEHRISPEVRCRNNLKALGLALHNWHDEHGRFPDVDCAEEGQPPLSWRVAVLPLLDQSPLHAQYDPSQPWDAAGNLTVALRDPFWASLSCPTVDGESRQDDQSRYFTSYVLVTGPQTAFPKGRGLPRDQVTDGLANTMLTAEASGLNIVWTQPRDFDVATQLLAVNLPGNRPGHSRGLLSSPHTAGAHAAFGDGAVRFISEEIDPQVLKALTTASGGEEIDGWDK